jgi:hypothetical protein
LQVGLAASLVPARVEGDSGCQGNQNG